MIAVIERQDGTIFYQEYGDDFYALLYLKSMLGDEYWICEIIDTKGDELWN